ncbi:hypothetical protein FisN_23Hh235 [Fistulifera solaris]|uniref:Uncharacterized protein n=1 Tax=Fistulifera solaris TaxID=1519565 RepID=A0A1Z5JX66_FISSO|nr:hypothetical protein FisN_23Hh235 [Fistulifera solaris]|eukprot:GAX18341.1 hypothetical protein FisN_23Hh235 [Fistulifera solaris]
MLTRIICVILSGTSFASSFVVKPVGIGGKARTVMWDIEKDTHGLAYDPMEDYQSIDMERAKQCAENFGECSIEEMEHLRNNLHRKRLQKFMFGSDNIVASEEALNQLVIEEELDMQLHLLKQNTPDPTLFPELEADMPELPHLKPDEKKDSITDADDFFQKAESMVKSAEIKAVEQEAAFDEESLEAAAICLAIAGLVFTPQLFGV